MRLNAQTDFSLRIMMFLATATTSSVTISEVAARLALSKDHTMRIVAKLVSKGLIRASRGRTGGLCLAKPAETITVADIVTSIEPDFALASCFHASKAGDCSILPACLLKGTLYSALEAFFSVLRSVTLADLTHQNQAALSELFRADDLRIAPKPRPRRRAALVGGNL